MLDLDLRLCTLVICKQNFTPSSLTTKTLFLDHEAGKLQSVVNTRSEKLAASSIGARPKGLSIKQSTNSVPSTPNSPKVSLGNSSRSPTSKRKSFHDNRKLHSVQ